MYSGICVINSEFNKLLIATEPKLTKTDWRFDGIPSGGEMIIICSFGNVMDPSVKCVPKQFRQPVANDVSESDIPHKELGLILDKVRGVKMYSVIYVCQDLPGMQMSRHYYLDKVKQLLEECTAPSGIHFFLVCTYIQWCCDL